MTGFNPRNSTRYTGTDVWLANIVTRNRRPTGADYRQPETGRNYVIFAGWQVAKDPTTGVEGELWLLSKIVANVAYWVQISGAGIGGVLTLSDTANTLVYPLLGNIKLSGTPGQIDVTAGANELVFSLPGGGGAVDSFTVDAVVAPGVNPVTPTALGVVTVGGAAVAAHSVPVETQSLALNEYNIAVQVATTSVGAPADASDTGLSVYNSTQFTVNANGYVSLPGTGAAFQGVTVDATSGTGTNPTVASAAGLIILTGAQVATGTIGANVIRSTAKAVNSITLDIQQTATAAAKDTTKNGVSHFNSAQFTNDEGFVSIINSAPPQVIFSAQTNAFINNVTGDNTEYQVIFGTTILNVGAGYNNATGLFTAPEAGYYMMNSCVLADALNNVLYTGSQMIFVTTNKLYSGGNIGPYSAMSISLGAPNIYQIDNKLNVLVYLDVADTCYVRYYVFQGPKTVNIASAGGGDPRNWFSGWLVYQP